MINYTFYLRPQAVQKALAFQHCPHAVAAKMLGLSASHWSRLANARVPVPASLRRRIVDSPLFAAIPEDEIWQVVGTDGAVP